MYFAPQGYEGFAGETGDMGSSGDPVSPQLELSKVFSQLRNLGFFKGHHGFLKVN